MELTIIHKTKYVYDAPVDFALQQLRLRPSDSWIQKVLDWQVLVDGGKIETSYKDHYGNHVDMVSAEPGAQEMTITASGRVKTEDSAGVLGRIYGRAPLWHFAQPTPLTSVEDSMSDLRAVLASREDALSGLHALSTAILDAVPYEAGHTDVATTAAKAVEIGKGVCQDHANIFVSVARANGLPARYVSGYLMMNDTIDQDASHAWAEVHLPELGWVGFDVSNGVCPDDRYIRLAVGRDAHDAAPIHGLRRSAGDESLIVSLQVQQ